MFAIDKDTFQGNREVTCYSCHRGSLKPSAVPPISSEAPSKTAAAAPKAEKLFLDLPTAGQLIDHYIQALGGVAAIAKITSLEGKGTTTLEGQSISIEVFDQGPNRQALVRHMPAGDSMTVFDGHEGWSSTPGRPVREFHGAELDEAQIDAYLHFPLQLMQMFAELRVEYPEEIGDREAYVILATRSGQPPVKLYFDKQSGLLVRLARYALSPLGLVPTRIDYGDYRDVGGVKTPFRWTVAQPDGSSTTQLEQIEPNVTIDDVEFAKPGSSMGVPKPPGQ
jgi:photosynthetic reaction center cytochrome c subunit